MLLFIFKLEFAQGLLVKQALAHLDLALYDHRLSLKLLIAATFKRGATDLGFVG